MNLEEFAALKVGDRIAIPFNGNEGTITEITGAGVRVCWREGTPSIFYSVNSTTWMHWAYPPRECTTGPCYRDDCRRGDQCLGDGVTNAA